ncbi:hypothetical protein V5799_012852 [Amblyomma americanum]|uniref:Peptidase M13 C-terminal domain-containing protein n=1 Tax=Amblyomma americanum TaxID=6943 RepID=A0AAQ4E7M9_AMBAM
MSVVKAYLAEAGVVWPLSPSNPDVLDTLLYLDFELNWASVLHFSVREQEGVTKVSVEPATSFSHLRFLGSRLKTKNDRRHYFDAIFGHYSQGLPQEHAYSQIEEVEELMTAKLESAMEHFQGESALPEPIEADGLYKEDSNWTARLAKRVRVQGHVQYFRVNARFVAEFLSLWSQHGDSKTHLYVSWCAVRFAALFANRELLKNHYGEDSDADGLEFRQYCMTESYKVFGEALFSGFSDDILTPHVRRDVRDLVLKIRRHSTSRLSSQQSFQEYSSLVAGWGSLDSVFFALEYHLNYDQEIPVAGLPDMSRSHVANWRAVSRARRTLNVSLGGAFGEDVLLGRSLFHLDKSVKDFVLAPFALVFPMYHIDLTPAVKYGTLGDHVGLATAWLALEHSDAWPNAQRRLNRSRQCVTQAFETLPQSRIDEVIAEVASLSALLGAFKETGDDKSLIGLDGYSALQTLFIAWCFMRCDTASLDREEEDPCSPALRLVDAFADAFRCLPGTYMNAKTKCTVF